MLRNCFHVLRFMKYSICNAKACFHLLYCKINVWQEAKLAVCGFKSLHAQCGTLANNMTASWPPQLVSVLQPIRREGFTCRSTFAPRAASSRLPVAVRLLQQSWKTEPLSCGSLTAVAGNIIAFTEAQGYPLLGEHGSCLEGVPLPSSLWFWLQGIFLHLKVSEWPWRLFALRWCLLKIVQNTFNCQYFMSHFLERTTVWQDFLQAQARQALV